MNNEEENVIKFENCHIYHNRALQRFDVGNQSFTYKESRDLVRFILESLFRARGVNDEYNIGGENYKLDYWRNNNDPVLVSGEGQELIIPKDIEDILCLYEEDYSPISDFSSHVRGKMSDLYRKFLRDKNIKVGKNDLSDIVYSAYSKHIDRVSKAKEFADFQPGGELGNIYVELKNDMQKAFYSYHSSQLICKEKSNKDKRSI